ncbi:Single tm domain protein [Entamoeba marina]
MKLVTIFLILISCSYALYELDDNCCFFENGDMCDCSAFFSCNIPPIYNGETQYLPPCVESECNSNCVFSGLFYSNNL